MILSLKTTAMNKRGRTENDFKNETFQRLRVTLNIR